VSGVEYQLKSPELSCINIDKREREILSSASPSSTAGKSVEEDLSWDEF